MSTIFTLAPLRQAQGNVLPPNLDFDNAQASTVISAEPPNEGSEPLKVPQNWGI